MKKYKKLCYTLLFLSSLFIEGQKAGFYKIGETTMNNRQTAIVSIFVLFAAFLTLCGCKNSEKEIIGLARSNIRPKTKISAKGGWMAFPECEYTFYGYAAVIDSDFGQFGGKPFGNDGSTVSAEASFYGISNRMLMSEWDDCWTLETDAHFLKSLEKSMEGSFRG